jgi:hypothetical protein
MDVLKAKIDVFPGPFVVRHLRGLDNSAMFIFFGAVSLVGWVGDIRLCGVSFCY